MTNELTTTYQKHSSIEKIINGKSVVVVGPSKHLVGKNLGKLIDTYDIVCRVNYIKAKGYVKDYGKRCDLFFYNCATLDIEMMSDQFKQNPDVANKIKLVVCPVVKAVGPDRWQEWPDDFVSPVVENFKKINDYDIPYYWIGIPNYRSLYNDFGVEPNSGMLTIAILLYYPIEELFLTGFSFYQQQGGRYEDVYYDSYLPQQFRNPKWSGQRSHKQGPQIEFFISKLKEHGSKIRIDSFLNNLLNLNHNNVLEL